MQRLLCSLLCVITLCGFADQSSVAKKRMCADLEYVKNVFEVRYAPLQWKKTFAGWDLDLAAADAKARLEALQKPTTKEFQYILKDFFNSACDYHVGINFYSTEVASLPFSVKAAEGRYFISYIDREQLPKRTFPFEVGDELITFDGHPVHDVVEQLRLIELGGVNTLETDQALAELLLTARRAELGYFVPSGEVPLTIRKKGAKQETRITLEWDYVPERIKDFSKLGTSTDCQMWVWAKQSPKEALQQGNFFNKLMTYPAWRGSFVGSSLVADNPHALGSRVSFIPPLGKKTWKADEGDIFDAYIFKTPKNRKVGYVRIPHYMGDEMEVEEFCQLMKRFESSTDALIIDQVNNPGGNLFYLYGLAAALAKEPMHTPKHHITLTQEEVHLAWTLLDMLSTVKTTADAKEVIGETLGGYPVSLETAELLQQFCQFIVDEWSAGKLYTDATHLFGVDKLYPHPKGRYTKPVLLLTNPLDFSAGDFFPAILADNHRVTILGTRTAGAGGFIAMAAHHNHSGILGFSLTASLAERLDANPIENLGVQPDIAYTLSVKDLQENYGEYVKAIVNAVDSLIAKH